MVLLQGNEDQIGNLSKVGGKLKYWSTSASVTWSTCLCDQFGTAPRSTKTVLTPSAKLGSTIAFCARL